jgi:hypothetical protein
MSAEQAKRGAQEALFNAIKTQAETNMRAALRATEKAQLLRDLAEAYRLTAGGTVRKEPTGQDQSSGGGSERRRSEGDGTADPAARKQPAPERPARKAARSTGARD